MSWILGALGPRTRTVWRDPVAALSPSECLFSIDTETTFIQAGGLEATCWYNETHSTERPAWVVVGTAVRPVGDNYEVVKADGWRNRLKATEPNLEQLGGHFAGVQLHEARTCAFVDSRGIRAIYWTRTDDHILISTRPEWIARLAGTGRIDFSRFGSHWQLANQLSTDCLLENIARLGPGERFHVDDRGTSITGTGWIPSSPSECLRSLTSELRAGTRIVHDGPGGISLGLSGGLDSRTLLAAGHDFSPLRTHTFGDDSSADARVARTVSARSERPHRFIRRGSFPDADGCIRAVRNHTASTMAVSPASAAIRMSLYNRLHESGHLLVDGGFGEIARRGYYRRLVMQNGRALGRRNPTVVEKHLRTSRGDLFTRDVKKKMEEGLREDLVEVLENLPDEREPEDLADLLSVRTRLPNFFGRAQAHLDDMVQNIMPFALPDVLESTFVTPVRERRGGKTVRSLIRRLAPQLAEIPLVRGKVTVPFWMPEIVGHGWAALKQVLGRSYEDRTRELFLERVRDWAQDTARSQAVREYAPYSYSSLRNLVDGYYEGDHDRAVELDWWIAFECWRRSFSR